MVSFVSIVFTSSLSTLHRCKGGGKFYMLMVSLVDVPPLFFTSTSTHTGAHGLIRKCRGRRFGSIVGSEHKHRGACCHLQARQSQLPQQGELTLTSSCAWHGTSWSDRAPLVHQTWHLLVIRHGTSWSDMAPHISSKIVVWYYILIIVSKRETVMMSIAWTLTIQTMCDNNSDHVWQ